MWLFRLYHHIILHLLYCCVSSIFALTSLVLMALCCAVLRFPFFCHVQVFSCEISLVCRMKYPHNCFSSHFIFLVIVDPLTIGVVCTISSRFSIWSSSRGIDVSTLSSVLASHILAFFLDTYRLSMSSLARQSLCMVVSLLVFGFICWSSSLVHFKKGPEYLTRIALVFMLLMRFLLCSLVSSCFFVLRRYYLKLFFFHQNLFDGVRI